MPPARRVRGRPVVRGKFLYVDGEQLLLRGVTYGPFRPEADGCEYHTPEVVERDFLLMSANGINAVRVYTIPPRWLLDIAESHGLWVLVGMPWEQHLAFLDEPKVRARIVGVVRDGAAACKGHPALLGLAIGNEIPATIVRWYGHRRIERFLHELYDIAKTVAPDALVTYVNYPTTEYLHLPFVDFMAMNVYLETRDKLSRYISRLHNIAGDKPLVLAEIGLDSGGKGEREQAASLAWQIRRVFHGGCTGAFVFAWTDEWFRGGCDILDWHFGLVTRSRDEKPALTAVREAYGRIPFGPDAHWPRVTVVVCSYNGSRTIRYCLDSVQRLRYPDVEVIVVDDGSTDQLAEIVQQYPVKLIRCKNQGLSAARNVGLEAATGEIVAYVDDDAAPEPNWLMYLVSAFRTGKYVGVGGPNIAPPGEGYIADAVAHSPGGPLHVLITDTEAEHIPGCNMAFLTKALRAVGGFDPQFRIAGDDVDLCWRLQEKGGKLGFSPGAVVWHKRRNSLRAYWRQQLNYGKAEAMLERRWPERYNAFGHISWRGRIYGPGIWEFLNWGQRRIFHGTWGTALFQSVYPGSPNIITSLAMMPEWYLGVLVLSLLFMVGLYQHPILLGLILAAAVLATLLQAVIGAFYSAFDEIPRTRGQRLKLRLLTMYCYLVQPVARLSGRLSRGLTPWRMRFPRGLDMPVPREFAVWSETWRSAADRLADFELYLKKQGVCVRRGGDFDRWDLAFRSGVFGSIRVRMAIEEHGNGKQLVRWRSWPVFPKFYLACVLVLALLGLLNIGTRAWPGGVPLLFAAAILALRASMDAGGAMALLFNYVGRAAPGEIELRRER